MAEAFDILKHLEGRDSLASPYRLMKFVGSPAPMGILARPKGRPEIDRSKMCVTKVISTESEDRSRDVVRTAGIDCSNHMRNPVVLLEHAQDGHYKYAVGVARTPDGEYTVRKHEGFATGQTWYSQTTLEGEQTFAMVDEGILPGASIGFRPIKARPMPWGGDSMQPPGLYLEDVELLEYSDCVLPDNPECSHVIAEILGKNVLAGKKISEVIYKSLAACLPARKAWTPGWTPEEKIMACADNPAVVAAPAPTETTAIPAVVIKSIDAITDPAIRHKFGLPPVVVKTVKPEDKMTKDATSPGPEYTPMDDRRDEKGGEEGHVKKPGAEAMEAHHDNLMDCHQKSMACSKRQEHEGVAKHLDDHLGKLDEMAADTAEKHRNFYPEEEPLREEDKEDEQGGEEGAGGKPPETRHKSLNLKDRPDFQRYLKRTEARHQRQLSRVVKRMRRDHMADAQKASDFLNTLGDHMGPWTDMHQAAAKYHAERIKCMLTKSEADPGVSGSGTEADLERENMKAVQAENVTLKATVAMYQKEVPDLLKTVKSLKARMRLLPAE